MQQGFVSGRITTSDEWHLFDLDVVEHSTVRSGLLLDARADRHDWDVIHVDDNRRRLIHSTDFRRVPDRNLATLNALHFGSIGHG